MAWTQSDVDALQAAIAQLAIGKRVVTVSYAGPPARSVTYAAAQLSELRELLTVMRREVGGASGYRLATTRSGL